MSGRLPPLYGLADIHTFAVLYFRIYTLLRDHLRRHTFQQVMVHLGQSVFTLRKINQMEQGICSYPDSEWQLNVDPSTLHDFRHRVPQDLAKISLVPDLSLL